MNYIDRNFNTIRNKAADSAAAMYLMGRRAADPVFIPTISMRAKGKIRRARAYRARRKHRR